MSDIRQQMSENLTILEKNKEYTLFDRIFFVPLQHINKTKYKRIWERLRLLVF